MTPLFSASFILTLGLKGVPRARLHRGGSNLKSSGAGDPAEGKTAILVKILTVLPPEARRSRLVANSGGG
jgi:hypothetical protein